MATFSNKSATKNEHQLYECIFCHYVCFKRYNYDRHIITRKHLKATKNEQNEQNEQYLCVNCKKIYTDRTGLWRHQKICDFKKHTNSNQFTTELVLGILQQNTELTNLVVEQNNRIIELAKNETVQNINIHNVNNINKTFNLNVFLNETCKDAMNIMDFIDSLQLQLTDLENVGKLGFVEGISKIIVKNLKALDVNKRPVHCADKKRDVIYIKDANKWEREGDDKNKIRNVIKKIAYKNQNLIPKFKLEHPGCNFSESKYADQYSKLVIEAMGGQGNNDNEKEDKIIKNITKEVVINKNEYT